MLFEDQERHYRSKFLSCLRRCWARSHHASCISRHYYRHNSASPLPFCLCFILKYYRNRGCSDCVLRCISSYMRGVYTYEPKVCLSMLHRCLNPKKLPSESVRPPSTSIALPADLRLPFLSVALRRPRTVSSRHLYTYPCLWQQLAKQPRTRMYKLLELVSASASALGDQ